MFLNRTFILVVLVLAVACGDDREAPAPAKLDDASLPGVYAGVFPCADCEGIEASLWLRSDGRYFFRQRYPADDAHEAKSVYNFGRWQALPEESAILLKGEGPRRTFMRADADTLDLRTASELPHRLTREPTMTDFDETVRMTGLMRMQGSGPSFTECLTGYVVAVSQRGDYARFRHQYRSAVDPGQPAFVEFDGRFSWSAEHALQSLTIERFVTIKEKQGSESCGL